MKDMINSSVLGYFERRLYESLLSFKECLVCFIFTEMSVFNLNTVDPDQTITEVKLQLWHIKA